MRPVFPGPTRIVAGIFLVLVLAGPGSVRGAECIDLCFDESPDDVPAQVQSVGFIPREIAEFDRLARDNEVLTRVGSRARTALDPTAINLLVWNIHKAEDRGFASDFLELTSRADLVLLQEAVQDKRETSSYLTQAARHEWHMASSFFYAGGIATGVATGAVAKPFSVSFIRSSTKELFFTTPKMSLISEFRLKSLMRRLLVVNVHAVNFVDRYSFLSNMVQIDRALRAHDGPVLLAGDFNTWSPARLAFLNLLAARNGLKEIQFRHDERFLKLDHVLVREVAVRDAEMLDSISSSDHKPITMKLSISPRRGDLLSAH